MSSTLFPFLLFLFIGWYRGAGVFGLIGCTSLSLSALHCRPFLIIIIITYYHGRGGGGDDFFIVQVHFVNCIALYFFHLIENTTILCSLLLCFDLVVIGRRDFFFLPASLLSILTPLFLPTSSVYLI